MRYINGQIIPLVGLCVSLATSADLDVTSVTELVVLDVHVEGTPFNSFAIARDAHGVLATDLGLEAGQCCRNKEHIGE